MIAILGLPRTAKFLKARRSVPLNLRSVFDQFVADYRFLCQMCNGYPWISYAVVAEMIKQGWNYRAQSPHRAEQGGPA